MRRVGWPLTLLALALGSCSEPLAPATPGPLLFESEWTGTGPSPFWSGFSITADGGVYSYDSGPNPIALPAGDEFTAAQLQAKYAQNRHYRAQLPEGETLSWYRATATEVRRAGLTEPAPGCPDLAVERFYVLIYDSAKDRYRRVLLHARAGMAQASTARDAHDLYLWILKVTGEDYNGTNECDPYP